MVARNWVTDIGEADIIALDGEGWAVLVEVRTRTGTDFGTRSSRKLIAWGGTRAEDEETGAGQKQNARVWFHDLSADTETCWTPGVAIGEPILGLVNSASLFQFDRSGRSSAFRADVTTSAM